MARMTAAQLRTLEQRYLRLAARAEEARIERNQAVRQALATGWTHAMIARATGLSRSRIGQIALGEAET